MIGVIEILQLWAPGRHARLEDFAVDALAACAGLAVAAALDWARQRLGWNSKRVLNFARIPARAQRRTRETCRPGPREAACPGMT